MDEKKQPVASYLLPRVHELLGQSFSVLMQPQPGSNPDEDDDSHSWGGIVFGIRTKPAKWHHHCALLVEYPVAVKCYLYLLAKDKDATKCFQYAFDKQGILRKYENKLIHYEDDPDLTFVVCKLALSKEGAELVIECLDTIGQSTEHRRWMSDTFSCCQSSRERRKKSQLLSTLKLRAASLPGPAKNFTLTDSDDEMPQKPTSNEEEESDVKVEMLQKPRSTKFESVQPWTAQELIATLLIGLGYLSETPTYSLRVDELWDKCCELHHPEDHDFSHCAVCLAFRRGQGNLLIEPKP